MTDHRGMTMKERVARAMSRCVQERHAGEMLQTEAWQAHRDDCVDREWSFFADVAEAAIAAMREPSPGMKKRFLATIAPGVSLDLSGMYRGAIDDALSEGTSHE